MHQIAIKVDLDKEELLPQTQVLHVLVVVIKGETTTIRQDLMALLVQLGQGVISDHKDKEEDLPILVETDLLTLVVEDPHSPEEEVEVEDLHSLEVEGLPSMEGVDRLFLDRKSVV